MGIKNIMSNINWKSFGAQFGAGIIGEQVGKRLIQGGGIGVPTGGKASVVVGIIAGLVGGAATLYSGCAFDAAFSSEVEDGE